MTFEAGKPIVESSLFLFLFTEGLAYMPGTNPIQAEERQENKRKHKKVERVASPAHIGNMEVNMRKRKPRLEAARVGTRKNKQVF